MDYSRKKVPETTLRLRGGKKKRWYDSLLLCFFFPSRPLKALHIGLSEALFQPSLYLSINAVDRSVRISRTTKKGQGKGLILGSKSAIFTTFFFFINVFFSFTSNLKCMDEVNYLFIVCLSLFFIFSLFDFYWFICFSDKKWSRFASFFFFLELFLCRTLLRREPFCLASVASGTAFPGRWSRFCSGVLPRRCRCEPCPWKRRRGGNKKPVRTTIINTCRPEPHEEFYSPPLETCSDSLTAEQRLSRQTKTIIFKS